jgi:glycosyltransferase involved in cell wall biosynthesis
MKDALCRPELLVVGLALQGSGFTRVMKALAAGLCQKYQVHWFGLGEMNGAVRTSQVPGVTLHYCPFKPHFPQTGAALRMLVSEIQPAIVLLLGQPLWLSPLLQVLRAARPSCRLVLYAPIEGTLANPDWLKPLALLDDCILYTEHARQSVLALIAACPGNRRVSPMPKLHVLPHGIDTTIFRPMAVVGDATFRREIRQNLFPHRPELVDGFLVLNANFPYPRKRLDLTIRGFAAFAAGASSDVYLCLHQVRIDRYTRSQIERLAWEAGIAERLLLNVLNPEGQAIADERLNLLYNACDIGLTTAMGEAWGLTSFEHGATGAAQIVPEHTSFVENWDGAAEFMPTSATQHLFYEYADMHTVEPTEVAQALERLYRNPALRRARACAAFANANAPRYRWGNVAQQLDRILVAP